MTSNSIKKVFLLFQSFVVVFFFNFLSFQTLDYEQVPNIHLSIGVKNQAEFHHSVASQFRMHSTPVRIQVVNVREGPAFQPNSMTFSVREGLKGNSLLNFVLGTYTAIDLDTGNPATNVRYCTYFARVKEIKLSSSYINSQEGATFEVLLCFLSSF